MRTSLNDIAPSFQQAVGKWPEANNLKQHYDDLLTTYESDGSSLIELTKSFFETVCLTIIEELGAEKPASAAPTTSEIFSYARKALNIDYAREANGLGDIISGFTKVTNGLEKLRNIGGSTSHGKEGFIQHVSKNHLRTHLLAADALVSLLLNVFEGTEPDLLRTREPYERFEHLNELIDQNIGLESEINIETQLLEIKVNTGKILSDKLQMNIRPSELLFELNRQAYKDIVQALQSSNVSIVEETADDVEEDLSIERSKTELKEEIVPTIPLAETYDGLLNEFCDIFARKLNELEGNRLQPETITSIVAIIFTAIEPHLVTDWKVREEIKSQIKLVLKKIIRENNFTIPVDLIFDWLAENLPTDMKGT